MRTRKRKLLFVGLFLGGLCAALAYRSYRAADQPDRGLHRPIAVRETPFPQHDVVVLGSRVRYIDVGKGKPVVLIPGLTSRIEELDEVTKRLSRHFRVLVFDYPGSGYSDKPDRHYSLAYYDDVLLAFLNKLDIRRCDVGGGSLGGNLALRAAWRFPGRIDRVAAWDPGSAWRPKPIKAFLARIIRGKTMFWPTVHVQSRYWYSEDFPERKAELDATFAYYDEVLSPGFIRMYWDLAIEQTGWSLDSIAGRIHRPTLLIWGDRDHGWSMGKGLRRLHRSIRGSRLAVIKGSGHAIATEKPAALSRDLIAFFSEEHTSHR